MAMHTDSLGHPKHGDTHAEGQQHAPAAYDTEINMRGVWLTMGGILVVTLLAMVAMWFLSLALIGFGESGDRALMPVEQEQRQRILQLENRLQGGVLLNGDALESDFDRRARRLGGWVPPGLDETWPMDVRLPPEPRVQYSPMNDWLILRDDQARRLAAPENPDEAGTRVSIEEAMDYVLSEGLVRSDATREAASEVDALTDPMTGPEGAGTSPGRGAAGEGTDEAATPSGTSGDGGRPPAAATGETDGEPSADAEEEGA